MKVGGSFGLSQIPAWKVQVSIQQTTVNKRLGLYKYYSRTKFGKYFTVSTFAFKVNGSFHTDSQPTHGTIPCYLSTVDTLPPRSYQETHFVTFIVISIFMRERSNRYILRIRCNFSWSYFCTSIISKRVHNL